MLTKIIFQLRLRRLPRINRYLTAAVVAVLIVSSPAVAFAGLNCGGGSDANGHNYPSVKTSIDFGCEGKGNPILDMTFAIIRFLSIGVGVVLIGSTIVAGVQYTMSKGEPDATAAAMKRLRANAIALLIFIFGYALLNYVVPGQLLGVRGG